MCILSLILMGALGYYSKKLHPIILVVGGYICGILAVSQYIKF